MVDMSGSVRDLVGTDDDGARADLNRGPVTYTSGNRGLPIVTNDASLALVAIEEALALVKITDAAPLAQAAVTPRPGARRRSPSEVFADVNGRHPVIMARLAE